MCGIAGFFLLDGARASRELAIGMRDRLAHRGPDAEGVYIDRSLALAHRRLAIIDLSHDADQPMVMPDGDTVIVFNGEIYNFRELRTELEAEGAHFRTRSDTEVLLWGYRHWGIEALARRIDGMAAFALWDRPRRQLHLVRDRYGTKPLYVWTGSRYFAFASEIKAFFDLPGFQRRINYRALNEYLTFQNLFRDHTLFEGVRLLPPASISTFGDGELRTRPFWDFDFAKPDTGLTFEDSVEMTEKLMSEAVSRQLVSDVQVGAYLSGGMDSGSIVSLAARDIPRITTFTAGFELSSVTGIESTFDERRDAELIANAVGAEHYEQVINAGDIRWALPRVTWHLEDLRVGMSYPNYYVARLASKFVKVCLSGAGGDEIFGGYPWRYYRVFRTLDRASYLAAYYDFWQRLTSRAERSELLRPEVQKAVAGDDMFEVFSHVFDSGNPLEYGTPEDHINNALYFESKTFLHALLLVGDRLSMANGLEERFPFLDNALVDHAQRVPVRHKLADLEHMLVIDEDEVHKKLLAQGRYSGGKSVLRKAMEHTLPGNIMERPKQGFSAPDESWFRGENADYVRDLLLSDDLACAEFLDPAAIRRVVHQHIDHKVNRRLLIWSLLSLEWWCRLFLRGDSPQGGLT